MNSTQQSELTVTQVILQQLGGHKFLVMTGAHSVISNNEDKALSMALPASLTKNRVNYCKVTLAADDTYTVFVGRVRGTAKGVAWGATQELTGVYCDQLQEVFTQLTGLFTSLR